MRKLSFIFIFLIIVFMIPSRVYAIGGYSCSHAVNGQEIFYDTGTTYTNRPLCRPVQFTGDPFTDGITIAISILIFLILFYLYKKIISPKLYNIAAHDHSNYIKKTIKKPN